MTALEIINLIGTIGLALIAFGLVYVCDKFVTENKALREEKENLQHELNVSSWKDENEKLKKENERLKAELADKLKETKK